VVSLTTTDARCVSNKTINADLRAGDRFAMSRRTGKYV
jgi:hypothetical protein